ncbi:uncharacterized protein METZ01_LOCUS154721, partial [marine metagenome]
VGNKVPPVRKARRGDRRFGDLEIPGAVAVIANQKSLAMVVDIVFKIRAAWLYKGQFAGRIVSVHEVPFGHVVARRCDE